MKIEFLYILIPMFIQGQYDFDFWYGYFKEASGHKWEWLYRLIKETADIPVTGLLLFFIFNWNIDLIGCFFTAKLFGWTDAVYIATWKIFNQGRKYTQSGLWWLWWTPLGAIRSQLVYRAVPIKKIPAYIVQEDESLKWFHLFGLWYLKKGEITLKEFYIQLAAGLVLSYLMYHFKVVSIIYKVL